MKGIVFTIFVLVKFDMVNLEISELDTAECAQ